MVLFHSLDDTLWHFELGAAGIHLFFTISGFVIWTSTAGRPLPPGAFLAARVRRIVPLYWLATLVAIASTRIVPGYFWQATTAPANVAASLLFIPHAGISGGVFPVLYQGWTLQYEMYFYAVFAACLAVTGRYRLPVLVGWFAVMITAGAVLRPGGPLAATYTNPISMEFVAGILVARFLPLFRGRLGPRGWAVVAGAGTALFLWADMAEARLSGFANLLIPLGTASVLLGLILLEEAGGLPRSRAAKLLGEASYSTYLFQTVGFAAVAQLMPPIPVLLRVVLLVLAAHACGLLAHRFVEKPLLTLRRTRATAAPGPPATC